MKRRFMILALVLLTIIGLLGCNNKSIAEEEDEQGDNPVELTEVQSAGDTGYDIEELKSKLLEAQTIEMKGIEGEPIGALQNRDIIINWVEALFSYPIQEAYPETNLEIEVIGPLNFYFSGNEDIYGLVKKDYIYIEGYYFLITSQQLAGIQNQFKANIMEKPVGGN